MKVEEVKLRSYATGFILSIVLTLVAYFAVVGGWFSGWVLTLLILLLALIQLVVQMTFFLYLANESGQRWKLAIFISTVSLVFIIVVGSIWIMSHLNYNMMPSQINNYLQNQSEF